MTSFRTRTYTAKNGKERIYIGFGLTGDELWIPTMSRGECEADAHLWLLREDNPPIDPGFYPTLTPIP